MSDQHYRTPDAGSARTAACPDFEDLSRLVDGELDEARAAEVGAHAMECSRCSSLVTTVGTWLDTAATPSEGSIGDSSCASMELLVGYLTSGLSDGDRHSVDQHVRSCDECIRTLALLHSRLVCGSEVDAAVPAAVLARVAAVLPTRNANAPVAYADWSEALSAVGGRLSDALKLPVLIPAAVAAGALLVVAEQQVWVNPAPMREMSRSVPMQQTLRVTASEAVLYLEPSANADVVGKVDRGTVVKVAGQDRDWYRVSLPDGKEGWVERGAFD